MHWLIVWSVAVIVCGQTLLSSIHGANVSSGQSDIRRCGNDAVFCNVDVTCCYWTSLLCTV